MNNIENNPKTNFNLGVIFIGLFLYKLSTDQFL